MNELPTLRPTPEQLEEAQRRFQKAQQQQAAADEFSDAVRIPTEVAPTAAFFGWIVLMFIPTALGVFMAGEVQFRRAISSVARLTSLPEIEVKQRWKRGRQLMNPKI